MERYYSGEGRIANLFVAALALLVGLVVARRWKVRSLPFPRVK